SKYFRGEGLDGGAFMPRIHGQAGFAAGLLEEGDAVPGTLVGDLVQKQSALAVHADQHAMAADFHGSGGNRLRRREDAEFNFQFRGFLARDWGEAGILERSGPGGLGDHTVDGAYRKNVSNASPQLAVKVKRGEGSAVLGEVRSRRLERNLAVLERG